MTVNDGLLVFECKDCHKNYVKEFVKDMSKRFENA